MKNLTNLLIAAVLTFSFITLQTFNCFAQNIGINSSGSTPNASALLDVDASPGNNKGMLIPRVTQAERLAMNPLPAAAQGLTVYQTDGTQGFYYNISTTTTPNWAFLVPDANPIGSIIAWHKSFTNTPALPNGWVECNGQVLSDAASVYNGQTIPDLNGSSRFLRGGAVSGTLQNDDLKSHSHPYQTTTWYYAERIAGTAYLDGGSGTTNGLHSDNTSAIGGSETRPINMSVVYIMRVK